MQNEFEEAKREISEELNFLISENERLSRQPIESQKTKERIKSLKEANDKEIDKLEAEKARVDEERDRFLSSIEEALDKSFHSLHNKDVLNEEESKRHEYNNGVSDAVRASENKEVLKHAKPQADKN